MGVVRGSIPRESRSFCFLFPPEIVAKTSCMSCQDIMARAMSYPRAVAILMIQGLGEANAQREVEGKGEDERCIAEKRGHSAPAGNARLDHLRMNRLSLQILCLAL
jgi:hypothetical protein